MSINLKNGTVLKVSYLITIPVFTLADRQMNKREKSCPFKIEPNDIASRE